MSALTWNRALVVGLGASGKAAAKLLLDRGVAVLGVDDQPAADLDLGALAGAPSLTLGGPVPAAAPAGVDGVVVSPGVPLALPLFADARAKGLPVIAEVELAFPLVRGDVVAITGSNGKSTTTALAGAMIAASGRPVEVCGNIGTPLSAVVDGPPGRAFVVELSSFQLEGIDSFRPRAGALLNLAPDHLDRYDGFAAYGEAKRRLFARQGPDDVAVLNADDPFCAATTTPSQRRFFSRLRSLADGCWLEGGQVVESRPGQADRELFTVRDVPLAGTHNLENALAASLLALAVGTEPAALRAGLRGFRGLPHRLERVAEADGVTWWDDSKGTNPAATVKSLEGFADGSVHLILGGRNKGNDPAELAPMVTRKAHRLYLIGEAAEAFDRALGSLVPAERSGTLAAAVAAARAAAEPGEAVVLSPACASFDQFQNYADRGRQFQRLVLQAVGRQVVGREV